MVLLCDFFWLITEQLSTCLNWIGLHVAEDYTFVLIVGTLWVVFFISLLAKQKMHCALRRTYNDSQKIAERETGSISTNLEKNALGTSSKDSEVSFVWENPDNRHPVWTFFAVEPDGHWRVVTLPLQCLDHTMRLGSGDPVEMDGPTLASPSAVSSVQVDQPKAERVPPTDRRRSVKSITPRSSSVSDIRCQLRNKFLAKKVSRWNQLLGNASDQNSLNINDLPSVTIPSGSNATSSSDAYIDIPDVEKPVKNNTRKKARKKGKQNKKLPHHTGSTEPECAHGCSTSDSGNSKSMSHVDKPLPCATSLSVLLPEVSCNGSDFEGSINDTINCSETLNTCASYTGKADASETCLPTALQNLSGEHSSNSECGIQTTCQDYSNLLSETTNSIVLDSVSLCSSCDGSVNCICDVRTSSKESGGDPSETPGNTSRKESLSHGHMSNSFTDSQDDAEETNVGRQVCSSSDAHSVVLAKTGKQTIRVPQSSSTDSFSSVGDFNDHSVWQKVQRNDTDDHNFELNKVNTLVKRNGHVVESNRLSDYGDKKRSNLKVSRKKKRKTTTGSKQDSGSYSRKGSHATKASSNECMKMDVQHNEILDGPTQVSAKKELASKTTPAQVSGQKELASETACSRIGIHKLSHEPIQSLHLSPNKWEPNRNVGTAVSSLNNDTAQNGNSLLPRPCTGLDNSELLERRSSVNIHQHVKQDHDSGSILQLQKRIPVGLKDAVLTSTFTCNDSLIKSAAESRTPKNSVEEKLKLDTQALPSSINSKMIRMVQGSGNGIPVSINQDNSGFENDSIKIAKAVSDAYSAQLASEAVQMATGSPIAEFERFLHAASPVVCLPYKIRRCQTCSREEVIRASLCTHEKPSISLGSLWQWYEKHGLCGLEVSAEDFDKSNIFGIDRSEFHAYFVPYLSAVQLFGNKKRRQFNNNTNVNGTEALEGIEVDQKSENSSSLGHIPIFSLLIPQPRKKETRFHPPRNHPCCSEPSSGCVEDNESSQPVDSACSDDTELLFEYFEVEQPQNRRPLFETIEELVRGDGPSRYRAYGVPSTLESIDLHDLHPRSWYSVAWYPIYRIPRGNFRATFLTYHSLGHLVCGSTTSDSFSMDSCIASPTVGLQSYNAQGECWFRQRHSAQSQMAKDPNLNPSGVMKERLRTLEQTASLMARAVVTKGNQTSVNSQPDYEFFVSRQR